MIDVQDSGAAASAFLRKAPSQEPVVLRLVQWLSVHRWWLGIITAGYLIFTITAHDVMQQPAYWAQGKLGSHRTWNNCVAAVVIPLLVIFCVWVLLALRRHERVGIAAAYLAITVILSAITFRTLLCMNIEVIHFPQYAILAGLLFALTGSFAQSVVWATLAALLDEGYQYLILYPDRRIYMDFNDVILNVVGAGFGLVTLYAFGVTAGCVGQKHYGLRSLLTSKAAMATSMLAVVMTSLYALGRLHLLPPKNMHGWMLILRRAEPNPNFWANISWARRFMRSCPWNTDSITVLLISFYGLLDKFKASPDCP